MVKMSVVSHRWLDSMFLEVFSNLNDSMITLTHSQREVIGRKGTRNILMKENFTDESVSHQCRMLETETNKLRPAG